MIMITCHGPRASQVPRVPPGTVSHTTGYSEQYSSHDVVMLARNPHKGPVSWAAHLDHLVRLALLLVLLAVLALVLAVPGQVPRMLNTRGVSSFND